jgi:hypothetical protein
LQIPDSAALELIGYAGNIGKAGQAAAVSLIVAADALGGLPASGCRGVFAPRRFQVAHRPSSWSNGEAGAAIGYSRQVQGIMGLVIRGGCRRFAYQFIACQNRND